VNYRATIVLGALLAVGITACDPDPYDDERGGEPAVIGVSLSGLDPVEEHLVPIDGTQDASGAWSVVGDNAAQNVVFVFANKLLDGATIQTSPADCTPAANWLTVTTTAPAITCEAGTPAWYTCYVPSSPRPEQGGSIAIFQACEAPSLDAGGWFDVGALAPSSTYTFTGQVSDRSGAPLPVNVTVTTAAEPPPEPPAPAT
jgi:hypothetical protein